MDFNKYQRLAQRTSSTNSVICVLNYYMSKEEGYGNK